MDGRRFTLLFFSVLFLVACENKKTVDDVAMYSSTDYATCPGQSLNKTQFIVTYEDGRVEVVHAENNQVLEKDFIEPNLQEIKRVEYDSKVSIASIGQFSADDGVTTQTTNDWGPEIIQADSAWNQGVFGAGVKVAVVDAAVDFTHAQIFPRLSKNALEFNGGNFSDDDGNGYEDDIYGWDFYTNSPTHAVHRPSKQHPNPNVHGTHVAGIILADPSQGTVQGVAPQAELIPVNFMDDDGGGDISNAITAIRYAVSRGAKVINASWGGGCYTPALTDAINEAGQKGALFVSAAGNDGYDFDRLGVGSYSYPAVLNLLSQITVAASGYTVAKGEYLASFSNRSFSLVQLAAPGENIRSTVPTFAAASGAGYLDGTSMATPFVSGAAALLWSVKPNATVAQIKEALLNSTDRKSFKVSTQGRLNVSKALDEIRRIAP